MPVFCNKKSLFRENAHFLAAFIVSKPLGQSTFILMLFGLFNFDILWSTLSSPFSYISVPVITGPVPVISPQPVHPPDPPQPANSTSSTTVYPTLVTTAVNTTSELPTQPTTGSEPVTSSSGSNFLRPTKKMRPDMMEQQGKPDRKR